jgi:hypothetical protein
LIGKVWFVDFVVLMDNVVTQDAMGYTRLKSQKNQIICMRMGVGVLFNFGIPKLSKMKNAQV